MPSSCSVFNSYGICKCCNDNTDLKSAKYQHGFPETAVLGWHFWLSLVIQGDNRLVKKLQWGHKLIKAAHCSMNSPGQRTRAFNKASCLWTRFLVGTNNSSLSLNTIPESSASNFYLLFSFTISSNFRGGRGQHCHCCFDPYSVFSSLQFSCCLCKHHMPKTKAYKNHLHFQQNHRGNSSSDFAMMYVWPFCYKFFLLRTQWQIFLGLRWWESCT